MNVRVADLLRQFDLERLEVNLFRGESRDIGSPQVYGGQVLGQALMAAYHTVEGLEVHSLHAYFLRRGDFDRPIVYQVDRSRDGHSISSRRVIAVQNGAQIFTCAASFQRREPGLDHQSTMPEVPLPDSLPDWSRPSPEVAARLPALLQRILLRERPVEFRPVAPIDFMARRPRPPIERVWLRIREPLGDDDRLHRALLAYMSDFNLLTASTQPHQGSYELAEMTMASIDHALWFHRPFRADQWLLYDIESPSASGARGFARGSLYSADGRLVASVAQEGLIRVRARGNSAEPTTP